MLLYYNNSKMKTTNTDNLLTHLDHNSLSMVIQISVLKSVEIREPQIIRYTTKSYDLVYIGGISKYVFGLIENGTL